MVGFKEELLFANNKKERTKDLPYFDKIKVINHIPYLNSNEIFHLSVTDSLPVK